MRSLRRSFSRWRYRRQQARALRWQRPLANVRDRIEAWASFVIGEYGVFQMLRPNLHRVAEGAWRSAQPTPARLRRWRERFGLRTIVNLRGLGEFGSWALERDAAERAGLRFATYRMRSRGLPTREELMGFRAFAEGLEEPVLFHCKSGADRAGLFAALYLIVRHGRPAAEAAAQLAWRYGHLKHAKAGVLDALIEAWRVEGEAEGLSFDEWARDRYDPEAITQAFRARFWSTMLGDRIMRRE